MPKKQPRPKTVYRVKNWSEYAPQAKVRIPPRQNAHIWQHGHIQAERLKRDENLRAICKQGQNAWKDPQVTLGVPGQKRPCSASRPFLGSACLRACWRPKPRFIHQSRSSYLLMYDRKIEDWAYRDNAGALFHRL